MNNLDLIIVANSPGELSALAKPVAETASLKHRIILVLTPCQYTSGKEAEYVKTLKSINVFISAEDYKNWILLNRKPKVEFSDKGAVLFLGGDLTHAMLVAKKAKYPAFAYIQERIAWAGFYKKFFAPDEKTRAKFIKHKEKIKVTGNLMVDSVKDFKKWSPQDYVITFLPGSRAWQINHTTPIYEKIISELKTQDPRLKIQLVSSPFEKAKKIEGVRLIKFEDAYNSELVITIPGTNTARLAALGIPMISVFPLDNPDVIPLEGLPHYLGKIPYLGSKFKKSLAETINRKTKFFALPNIKAEKEIIPEIRGVIDPAEVAAKAMALLRDKQKRAKMSRDLIKSMGKPGASRIIMEEINEALQPAD